MPQEAENPASKIHQFLSECGFEIGGEDQMVWLRTKIPSGQEENGENSINYEDAWKKLIADIQIRVGTLLKTDTVSFLFGAGASKACGGVLIGNVPLEIEKNLLESGIVDGGVKRVSKWLKYFYLAVQETNNNDINIPSTREEILQRRERILEENAEPLNANYEMVLSILYRWSSVVQIQSNLLSIGTNPPVKLEKKHLDVCLRKATQALTCCCQLPMNGRETRLETYNKFFRKILTRPLNLKRVNIFTLNYDTLVEQAADAEGVVLIDGFIGTLRRVFRPECYDQDLYFPAETTEGRVQRHDRVSHLYKLHGSINWVSQDHEWDNPYGLVSKSQVLTGDEVAVIYPTPTKFGETLGMPYAELFRRFAVSVVRPQSTLFVIGYGFGDDHVNSIIRQALAVPSFTLIIVDPQPQNNFVQKLKERKDQRTWLFSGEMLGTFSEFVDNALPDLRDEDIRKQVSATFRYLKQEQPKLEAEPDEQ